MTTEDLIAALPPLADGVRALVSHRSDFEYEPGQTAEVWLLSLRHRRAPEDSKIPYVIVTDASRMSEGVEALRKGVESHGYFRE